MAIPQIPVTGTETVTHRRRVAESINDLISHRYDDWRRQTQAEKEAGITPINPAFPPGDVRRYGAVGDGATDDTSAIQRAFDSRHDVIFEAEKSYFVSSGLTWTRNYAVIYANGARLVCTADITPLTIGTTSGDPQLYAQILGNLRVEKTSGTPTLPGILMRGVYNSRLEVSAKGFYDNIEIRPSGSMGFAYNAVYMQDMVGQARSGLYLNPNTSAFVNENDFYHGRFDSPSATCTALIYAPDSGGAAGNPNNNRFHEPNLELSGTATVTALYIDGGHHNALIHPRIEVDGSATVSTARIYITSDALLAFVDDRYIGGTQYIRNDGTNTRFLCSTQRFAHYRDAAGAADVGDRVFRSSANSNSLPVTETYDLYIGSGDSQAHLTGLARNTSGGYFELYRLSGALVSNNGRLYECIVSHTSGASTEPGVGASWTTNWRLLPTGTDTAGSAAWATSTSYGAPTEQGRVGADGGAKFKTLTLDTAAPTVSSGQVGFGATTSTTVGAAGAATALPANPTGYLVVNIAGTAYKIPYYAS